MVEDAHTLVTFRCSVGERRAIRAAARARGQTVSGWLRELLKRELVDLIR
jgi:uncharacterized protein (DUF1778 family)